MGAATIDLEAQARARAHGQGRQGISKRSVGADGGAELVAAFLGEAERGDRPVPHALLTDTGQLTERWRLAGADPADPQVQQMIARGIAPIAGGATGVGGAAFMHNLPPEGEYVQDSALFNRETERNDLPLEQKDFTGLDGAPMDLRINNIGVLAKIRMVFVGSLKVEGTGTCTTTYQWPWNALKRVTLNANGQTSLVSAEGLDLRARRQRLYRNPTDPVSTAPKTTAVTKDPEPGTIENGTYPVVLVYDIPISHDDWGLTGSLFAQSDQIYLNWRVQPAATADLFTLTESKKAILTGKIHSTLTFYDIPYADTQEGRKVLVPDLSWLHGYIGVDFSFANTGEVKTPFIRNAGQLLSVSSYIDNGGKTVIDKSALSEERFEYGGNRRPRVYSPPTVLLEKNVADYNGRILPAAGFSVLDFEVDNPQRDLVYPKGVTELALAVVIPVGTEVKANARVHMVQETLFAGR
jgi:hypothetical protein